MSQTKINKNDIKMFKIKMLKIIKMQLRNKIKLKKLKNSPKFR